MRLIKQVFGNLDGDQQIVLVQELMEVAKIDSIIGVKRRIMIAGTDITAPKNETPEEKRLRTYKQNFEDFVRPFLSTVFRVVRQDYLDICFAIYEILARNSVGGRYYGQEEDGDKHLYAVDRDHKEDFKNEREQEICFEETMFSGLIDIKRIRLFAVFPPPEGPDDVVLSISFADLLMIAFNDASKAYVVLYILGFLDLNRKSFCPRREEEKELSEKAKVEFSRLFPDNKNLKDVFTTFIHPQGLELECPLFPGLRYM